MKLLFNFILLFCYCYSYSQTSIINDDFGGYQFDEQITEIILKTRQNKINHIELNLVEYRSNDNNTIYSPSSGGSNPETTKFIFKFETDSTFCVTKIYKHGKTCFISGYKFLIKNDLFFLSGTFPIAGLTGTTEECKDIHSTYNYFPSDTWSSEKINDTLIFTTKREERKIDPITKDTIFYDTGSKDVSTYFINTENQIIKEEFSLASNTTYDYSNPDTLIIKHFQSDGLISTSHMKKETIKVSKNVYIIKETIIRHNNYSNPKYAKHDWNDDIETITIEYKLNKDSLPVEIKILESNEGLGRIKGSTMSIKY